MQFNISIIAVEKNAAVSKSGKPYDLIELSYKNLQTGKVEGTKIVQYNNNYKIAAQAQAGEVYTVTKEKVGEFWNWTSLIKTDAAKAEQAVSSSPVTQAAATVRSSYETPEERAVKQVYIVKQSSIANSVAMLSVGAKKVELADVLSAAQAMTDFVFGNDKKAEPPLDLRNTPDDLEDSPF